MRAPPTPGVPELAGLATYAEAARIGYSVDENVRRLLRYQWTERRLMTALLSPLSADAALAVLLDEALFADDAVELLAGSYGVVRAALAEAYRRHLSESNPLVDQPTRRVIRMALLEHDEALEWSRAALAALTRDDPKAAA